MNKPRKKIASGGRKAASGGWRLHDDRPPTFRGWISTDEGEIGRREWRGRTEIVDVHPLDGSPHPFGDYRVTLVERQQPTRWRSVRSGRADQLVRVPGPSHQRPGDLQARRGRPAPPARESCRPDERAGNRKCARSRAAASRSFSTNVRAAPCRMTVPEAVAQAEPALVQGRPRRHHRRLCRDSRKAFAALRDLAHARPRPFCGSPARFESWIEVRKAPGRRQRAPRPVRGGAPGGPPIARFSQAARCCPTRSRACCISSFGERVLLADDMGLGKTVQAIAACALLRELRGISRVLVISPASLKAEWDEQIAKFTDLSATIVKGNPRSIAARPMAPVRSSRCATTNRSSPTATRWSNTLLPT